MIDERSMGAGTMVMFRRSDICQKKCRVCSQPVRCQLRICTIKRDRLQSSLDKDLGLTVHVVTGAKGTTNKLLDKVKAGWRKK